MCCALPTARGATASGWRARACGSRPSTSPKWAWRRRRSWRPTRTSRSNSASRIANSGPGRSRPTTRVVAIFVQFADPAMRERLFANMIGSLKRGGVLVLQGYTPKQLEYKTGGPPFESHLYTAELLRNAFAAAADRRVARIRGRPERRHAASWPIGADRAGRAQALTQARYRAAFSVCVGPAVVPAPCSRGACAIAHQLLQVCTYPNRAMSDRL